MTTVGAVVSGLTKAGEIEMMLVLPIVIVDSDTSLPTILSVLPVVIAAEPANIVPVKLTFALSVVAPVGTQNTLAACAPLVSTIAVFAAWFNAPLILKIYSPLPESVIGPELMFAIPSIQ